MSAPSPPPPPRPFNLGGPNPPGDGDGGGDRRGKRPAVPAAPSGGGKRQKASGPVGGSGSSVGGSAADPVPAALTAGRGPRRPEPVNVGDSTQHPCCVCGKTFSSWKALYGHMRCHPERRWRGVNPPGEGSSGGGGGGRLVIRENEVAASLVMLSGVGGRGGPVLASGGRGFTCTGCKKVFPTRQALGGHRATHKNVKGCFAMAREEGESSHRAEVRVVGRGSGGSGGGEQQGGRRSERRGGGEEGNKEEHKCSVCSMVFESGQALGAHMRTHNSGGGGVGPSSTSRRRGYVLDLNQPAPEEKEESSPSIDLNRSL